LLDKDGRKSSSPKGTLLLLFVPISLAGPIMPNKNKKLKIDPSVAFSKNLLGLKFMQRVQKEKDTSCDDETMDLKRKCIVHPSYQFCERLKFGRLSFKGMNMEVETLMQEAPSSY
jgi:hypothetical protein